jgi:hypothetical protein
MSWSLAEMDFGVFACLGYNITITIENQNVKGKVILRKESRHNIR